MNWRRSYRDFRDGGREGGGGGGGWGGGGGGGGGGERERKIDKIYHTNQR